MRGVIKHKLPSTHEEWLQDRLKGIGGSDAGALLGFNHYKSAYTLWAEKTGMLPSEDIDNESMRQGRDLEEYVARRFEQETGKKVRKSGFSFQSKEHPFMLANVDRLIVGEKAGLECKTASALTRTKYDKGDIPASYYAQCVHYMAVTGLEKWYIAILVLGRSFHIFEINRNEEEIADLIQQEEAFWSLVEDRMEPAADASESTAETLYRMHPESDGQSSYLDIETDEVVDSLLEVKERIASLKKMQTAYENCIKQSMKESERAEASHADITWKTGTSERVDTKTLKKEFPEVYKRCLKETRTRRFLVKKKEKER